MRHFLSKDGQSKQQETSSLSLALTYIKVKLIFPTVAQATILLVCVYPCNGSSTQHRSLSKSNKWRSIASFSRSIRLSINIF